MVFDKRIRSEKLRQERFKKRQEVRSAYRTNKFSMRELSEEFGVALGTVWKIINSRD